MRGLTLTATGRVDAEAQDRAWDLLHESLDGEQRRDLARFCAFTVTAASGRTYEVEQSGWVTCREVHRQYCLQPEDPGVPWADAMLARKLWLEADEAGFLARANEFPVGSMWDATRCRCDIEFQDHVQFRTFREAREHLARGGSATFSQTLDAVEGVVWRLGGRRTDERSVELLMDAARERRMTIQVDDLVG